MSAHDDAMKAARQAFDNTPRIRGDSTINNVIDATVAAYLSHMRAAGFVVARVPDAKHNCNGHEYLTGEGGGWNACRAAMLEGDKP